MVKVADRDSVPATIAIMAKTAREASQTFAFREWAARLATKAGPRDYVGQLRELYNGILERWRYVQEPGEWVHGSARSLIACVLGTRYNGHDDARNLSLANIPSREKGWGDCDDVSTAVAAGVLALGMQARFRVVVRNNGGHVSVVAITPKGETVSLDPVGHPNHTFGWMLPAATDQVSYYDMYGANSANLGRCDCRRGTTRVMTWGGKVRGNVPATFARVPLVPNAQGQYVRAPAPTVLAVPAGYMRGGEFADGLVGIDENGLEWNYDGGTGSWTAQGMAGWADIKRRWKKRIKAVKKVVKKVVKLTRKVQAKILGSKIAQKLVGAALQVWGVPFPATAAVMQAAKTILDKGGLIGLIKLLKKSPKAAFQLVAKAVKQGLLASNLVPPAAKKYLSGEDDGIYAVPGNDGNYYEVSPISAVVELSAVPDYKAAASVPDAKAELNNVSVVLQVQPQAIGSHARKKGQGDSDWYTDAVYFATYPKAPANAGSSAVYKAAWIRINKAVLAAMANANVTKPALPSSPTTKASPIFAVNAQEQAIARQVVADRPTSQAHQGKTYQRQKQTDDVWFTDVAYWRAYPNGPHKIPKSDKSHAQAWLRMQTAVKQALAQAGTPAQKVAPKIELVPATIPPITAPPSSPNIIPIAPMTPAANSTVPTSPPVQSKSGSQCWEDVNQSICVDFVRNPNETLFAKEVVTEVPRTETTRAGVMQRASGQTEAQWLANVAYWRAYPAGPIKIPDTAPLFAEAWARIHKQVKAAMKASSVTPSKPEIQVPDVPSTLPDLPDLPDVTPDVGPDIQPPKTEQKTNWLPIAAAAAAFFLLGK